MADFDFDEKTIEDRSTVFVGNLDKSDEDSLRSLFAPFGTIVRVKVHAATAGISASYAFVQFDNPESATKAIKELHGVDFDGRKLKVSPAGAKKKLIKSTNLYLTNIPKTYSKDDLANMFTKYGKVIGSRILTLPTGESRGVGLIRLENHESCEKAIVALNGKVPPDGDSPMSVNYAREKDPLLAGIGAPPPVPTPVMVIPDQQSLLNYYQSFYGFQPQAIGGPPGAQPQAIGNPLALYAALQPPAVAQNPAAAAAAAAALQSAGLYPTMIPTQIDPSVYGIQAPTPTEQAAAAVVGPRGLIQNNLYVVGIPESYSKLELDGLFSPYGRVLGSRILTDSDGKNRGLGFVRLDSGENALMAIQHLNGSIPPKGTVPLEVKLARNQMTPKLKAKAEQALKDGKAIPQPQPASYGPEKNSHLPPRFNPMVRILPGGPQSGGVAPAFAVQGVGAGVEYQEPEYYAHAMYTPAYPPLPGPAPFLPEPHFQPGGQGPWERFQ